MNLAWPSADIYAAPHAHFSDGLLDLIWMEQAGRASIAQMLLGFEDGSHVGPDRPSMHYWKVKAVRLVPGPRVDENGLPEGDSSLTAIDGERLPRGALELRVFRGVLNIFAK